jgi:hypothetical protein
VWRDQRRPEIVELFCTHVYGRAPVGRPASLKFETSTTPAMMEGTATRKQVAISYEGRGGKGTINLTLFVPSKATKPVPCFVLICNRGRQNIDPTRTVKSEFWPAEQTVARGYAAAAFQVGDVVVEPAHLRGKMELGAQRLFVKRGSIGQSLALRNLC